MHVYCIYAPILTWVWWLISAYLRVICPIPLAEGNSDLGRVRVMLIIKERASGPDSESDTYILCGSICHATYFLNGRATIIDIELQVIYMGELPCLVLSLRIRYMCFTWESYHELSTRKFKRFTWDLRPCVHKFYVYCTITTHSIPDCSRPALLVFWIRMVYMAVNLEFSECQADIYCILVRNDDTLSNRAGLMSDLITK